MKYLLFLVFLLIIISSCSKEIKQSEENCFNNFEKGIEGVTHDFNNINYAIQEFNNCFLLQNPEIKIRSKIIKVEEEKSIDYEEITFSYSDGKILEYEGILYDNKVKRTTKKIVYKYNNGFLLEEKEFNYHDESIYIEKTIYTRDDNGNLLNVKNSSSNDEKSWKYNFEVYNKFDSSDRIIESEEFTTGVFGSNTRDKYQYFPNKMVKYTYLFEDSSWNLNNKTKTYFNEQNKKIKDEEYRFVDNEWRLIFSEEILYDSLSNKIQNTFYNRFFYKDLHKNVSDYIFNKNNQVILKKFSHYKDKYLIESYEDSCIYDIKGNLVEYNYQGHIKFEFSYDEDEFIRKIVLYSFDEDKWTLFVQVYQEYEIL